MEKSKSPILDLKQQVNSSQSQNGKSQVSTTISKNSENKPTEVKEAGSDSSESGDSDQETVTPLKKVEGPTSGSNATEPKPKKKKKKKNDAKMKRFAETVGVEDNENYPKFKDKERLVINMSNTKYFVIKFVAKSLFNFKLTYKNQDPDQMDNNNYDICQAPGNTDDWDIFWTDGGVLPERIAKMKPYQKVNHFPGMFQLARKNHLARNLVKMAKEFPAQYKFFPKTYLLPSEFGEFKQTFANKSLNNRPVYIVKPEAGCQGRGIFLTNNPDDLEPDDHYVVQQYIKKPMLIEDLKFDCRLYVMVYSIDPMRIYLFKEGLARFSTDPYKTPSKKNMGNMFMHLTNYAINAKNKGKFVFNKGLDDVDTGHKRTFTSILEYIQENYDDGEKKCDEMMHKIEQLIIKTMITVQPSLKHYLTMPNKAMYTGNEAETEVNSMCFEILGFDVLIDEKLKPWLIEINHAPSFATDTPLDFKMKKDVIADSIQLLGMTYKRKKKFVKIHKANLQKRMMQQKSKLPLKQIVQNKQSVITSPKNVVSPLKAEPGSDESSESESEYVNQYTLIFPSQRNTQQEYDKFFAHSEKCYAKFTGSWVKPKEDAVAKAQAEKEASQKKSIVRYPFSPAKLKTPMDTSASKALDSESRNNENPYNSALNQSAPGGRTSSLQLNSQQIGEQIIMNKDPLQNDRSSIQPLMNKNNQNFFSPTHTKPETKVPQTLVLKNNMVNNLPPGTYMVKLTVDQLKALQSMKMMELQQANPQYHFQKPNSVQNQLGNIAKMQFSQMNSNNNVTEQQQSEILRLIMENTADIKPRHQSDLKENMNLRHSQTMLKPKQIATNASASKVQTIDQNTDMNRKRSVFDQKPGPYKMDYTDSSTNRRQSTKTGVLSMATASTRQDSSQYNQRRIASSNTKQYTHTLPGTGDQQKRSFQHFGVSPAKDSNHTASQKMYFAPNKNEYLQNSNLLRQNPQVRISSTQQQSQSIFRGQRLNK